MEPISRSQKTFHPEPIIRFKRWFLYIFFSSPRLFHLVNPCHLHCQISPPSMTWPCLMFRAVLCNISSGIGHPSPPPFFWRVGERAAHNERCQFGWEAIFFFFAPSTERMTHVFEKFQKSRPLVDSGLVQVLFSLNASSFIPPIYLLLLSAPVPLSSSFSDRKQAPCCVSPITAAILIPSLSPVLSPLFSPAISRSA